MISKREYLKKLNSESSGNREKWKHVEEEIVMKFPKF